MATLTVVTSTETGAVYAGLAAADAGLSDVFLNTSGEKTYLMVDNGGASPCVVTITAQDTSTTKVGYGTVTKANGGDTVAAGAWEIFGPFPPDAFNNASGQVEVSYDQVSSVSVVAFTK